MVVFAVEGGGGDGDDEALTISAIDFLGALLDSTLAAVVSAGVVVVVVVDALSRKRGGKLDGFKSSPEFLFVVVELDLVLLLLL